MLNTINIVMTLVLGYAIFVFCSAFVRLGWTGCNPALRAKALNDTLISGLIIAPISSIFIIEVITGRLALPMLLAWGIPLVIVTVAMGIIYPNYIEYQFYSYWNDRKKRRLKENVE